MICYRSLLISSVPLNGEFRWKILSIDTIVFYCFIYNGKRARHYFLILSLMCCSIYLCTFIIIAQLLRVKYLKRVLLLAVMAIM